MENQQPKTIKTSARGEKKFAAMIAKAQPSERGQVLRELQKMVTLHSINSFLKEQEGAA